MPGDEAPSNHGPRVFVTCLVLLAPLLLSGFAALLWTLAHALVGTSSEPNPEVPPFCCPEAIQTIIMLSNLTVDPCNNFISYACYKKSELDRQAIVERALASAVLHPTLQGKLRSPVSDILRMHHGSCLVSAVSNLFTAEHAVKAVIDLFRRWSGTSTISPHAVNLLKLVGLLHFRYYIHSIFKTEFALWRGGNETVYVIGALAAPYILTAGPKDSIKYNNVMFEAANSYTGLNVTPAALITLIARLRKARKIFDETLYSGKLSLLDQVFPNADVSSWKVILRTFPLIGMEDPPNLAAIVEVLIDKDASVQAAAFVYFSVHTAWYMFHQEMKNMEVATSLVARASFCGNQIVQMFPLWDVLLTQRMTSPDRDAVVLQLFEKVADAVVADALVAFSARLNSSEVRRVVRGVRVVLAMDMTAPYSHHLPDASDNYFENIMELRDFYFQVVRINSARGLLGLHRSRENLFQAFVSRVGNSIVISAGVYALLNFNATHRGNRTRVNGAVVNNAAVLGILLADALWDALIDRKRWDLKTGQHLSHHAHCMRAIFGRVLAPDLKHPLLSLRSTARAIATPGWHRRVLAFGLHSFSASQIFFMLFALHHSCQTLNLNNDDFGLRVSTAIRHLEEFCDAFGCASRQVNWATVCEEDPED
ncbi:hypothetical protein HPB49_013555 [Dermacentor silvarum]|uniref:Uncharacterized protein n=1 Tax=Dermacentor silvarum TaxID=543639 RepID=A0ACB8CLF1_DERSI|nr:hypothetical protein HPB49_013555 [Dermacentor silvarum]